MANATVNLSLAKSGYVKQSNPYTVYTTNTGTEYLISEDNGGNDNYIFFGFADIPSNLRHNVLIKMGITFAARCGTQSNAPWIYVDSVRDFDPSTLNYNNKPGTNVYGFEVNITGTSDNTLRNVSQENSSASETGQFFKSARCVSIRAYDHDASISTDEIRAKTVLANGSTRPYVTITYDNSTKIKSKISITGNTAPKNNTDPTVAHTVTWDLVKDTSAVSGYCADETWAQRSGAFYYRIQGQSTWKSISVGSTKSVTIQANTLTAGVTYEYYIQVTDEDGTTSTYGTYTFTTTSPTLTVYNLPSGDSYDTRPARTINWTLKVNNTEYQQASTTFYWRKSGESTWHTITASGNAKNLTIPANTFPTGATIERYVVSTDVNGNTYTLSTTTFTTLSSAIAATVFPSGNNVESGTALNFEWEFSNSLGNYDQRSATLYWRSSTSESWKAIQASGSTKKITVPKNTFPGNGATVYWYLEGTDIGGTTTTAAEKNFKTVTSQITPQNSPTSGYADPRNAITFSWYFATRTASYDQASAVFHWRITGTSTWTDVAASGSTTSVTIQANTFPVAGSVDWYVSGTDAGGCSSQSAVYTISTTASTAYAVCQSPVGRVEDGTKEITFRWTVQNSDGSEPARMRLWWKLPTEAQSAWHLLLDTTNQIFEYTVPGGTFDAGPVEWRVQATNRDNIDGPVNDASFVVLKAPDPPSGLSATNVPRTTISWQSAGQEAFEITIDGEIVAAEYGPSVYSWTVPGPLEDGVHHIKARIQGSYGLWSSYAETSIAVENSDSATLVLSGEFGTDAVLSLHYRTAEPIRWYRDGKLIAVVSAKDETSATLTDYTDRLAIGKHSYFARIFRSNGNYAQSNTVTGIMNVDETMIAPLSGGAWLKLNLSENSDDAQAFSWSRTSTLQHITGAVYPILELSPYEDRSGTFNCAFDDDESARSFEALRGQNVILKSRRGNMIVGGLTTLDKQVRKFFTTYTFSINQTHVEDYYEI